MNNVQYYAFHIMKLYSFFPLYTENCLLMTQVAEHTWDLPLGSTSNEEMINFAENLSVATCMPEENGLMVSIIKRYRNY